MKDLLPAFLLRTFASAAILLLTTTGALAQVRLNGYATYVFADRFDTRYSNTSFFEGRIEGGLQWGAGLEFNVREDYGIEVLYFRQDTEAPISYYRNGVVDDVLDLGINYIFLGGTRYLNTGGPLEPFAGLQVGMVIYDNKRPNEGEPSSATRFAWGARLGTNVWLARFIGLKVQAHLHSAVQSVGGGFYFGTGGVGAGVSTYSTLFQFGLGGGLVLRFGG